MSQFQETENVSKKLAEMILKYKEIALEIQRMWNVKKKDCDIGNIMGNWSHLKITKKIPDQHTGKARN